jgi:predicted nucleic acid-binding protein
MRDFFDTSVLVPAFLDEHAHHEASLAAFLKADKKHSCCAAHSLAEFYSTLTRMPGKYHARPEEALLFLENLDERLTFITLDPQEYYSALVGYAELGIAGGRIYDGLLARCALKARAEFIYTWNLDHFRVLGPEVARRVRTP